VALALPLPWKPELQHCRLKLGVGRKREEKSDKEGGGISAGMGEKGIVSIVTNTHV